ncbi:CHAT domain-containing protein [Amycolatopsis sp. NPDC051128]|uniref:caspase, EACC1-associated type n=1 Tax=Amycolatopsis sp. NPDC051128 TaxID=3155412 RepID=UPI003435C83F
MLADPTRSRAVLLGTHHYDHLEDIPSVADNVERLRQLLTDPTIWGLPEANCTVWLQPDRAESAATMLEDAATAATDTLIFYYAGHGLTASKTLELGLAVVNSRINARHTVLPFEWIRDPVLASRATRKVVILDCCYSGRAIGGLAGGEDFAQEAEIEGTYIFTAAAETKKALAPPGERYTAFTGELINVLESGVDDGPPVLNMATVYENVRAALVSKSRPVPQQRNRNTADRIAFARNKAYHRAKGSSAQSSVQEHRAQSQFGLAEALRVKAENSGDVSALDEAIALYREVLQIASVDSADKALYLAKLGDSLRVRIELTGDRLSLSEAVSVLRDAVTAAPEAHTYKSISLAALGNALRLRAQVTGDSGALSEAVQVLRAAVEASQPGRPEQASSLAILGTTLWGVAATRHQPTALEDALDAWEKASKVGNAPTRSRIEAAQRAGHAAIDRGEIERGSASLNLAVRLLPKLASWNIDLIDRERQLADFLGLASDAAAVQLMRGRVDEALELLESGRSVLFSRILELRPDFESLRMAAPELAIEFEEKVREVSVDWTTLGEDVDGQSEWPPQVVQGQASDSRHRAAERLEELIEDARRVPEAAQVLQPLAIDQIRSAGLHQPVVVVNVSRYRCDALILHRGDLHLLELPDLTVDAVNTRAAEFLGATDPNAHIGAFEERITRQQTISDTLEWLWQSLAEPVLNYLCYTDSPDDGDSWPRIFWCPTGLLSLLPIHAAGRESQQGVDPPSAVIDRVVSSYTTTIRALILAESRISLPEFGDETAPLLVGLPSTPDFAELPGVAREIHLLSDLFPKAAILSGREATRAALRDSLPSRPYAHFASHAISDVDHPVNSGLALWDGLFSVRDICKLHIDGAQLVVLSGCSTQHTAPRLADEAIHIASAFQVCGYRHVIGTMWPIDDQVAPIFAKLFYGKLKDGNSDPAFALHQATLNLRSRYPNMPYLWAAQTHLGPSRVALGETIASNASSEIVLRQRAR